VVGEKLTRNGRHWLESQILAYSFYFVTKQAKYDKIYSAFHCTMETRPDGIGKKVDVLKA